MSVGYISKGIAERVSIDPPTIRLLFDHKNTDQASGNDFYSQSKQNRLRVIYVGQVQYCLVHGFQFTSYNTRTLNIPFRCVVCGEDGHYLRYRIVPSCYRKHFPAHLKVVLVFYLLKCLYCGLVGLVGL